MYIYIYIYVYFIYILHTIEDSRAPFHNSILLGSRLNGANLASAPAEFTTYTFSTLNCCRLVLEVLAEVGTSVPVCSTSTILRIWCVCVCVCVCVCCVCVLCVCASLVCVVCVCVCVCVYIKQVLNQGYFE